MESVQFLIVLFVMFLSGILVKDTVATPVDVTAEKQSLKDFLRSIAEIPAKSQRNKDIVAARRAKKMANNLDHQKEVRGVLDKLQGKECKFYGQDCNALTLKFCCSGLSCLRSTWYSPAGLCRFQWEK